MAFLLLFIFGALHGLQPDHAASAAALATRNRMPAWFAALQVAAGHALALAVAVVCVRFLPTLPLGRLEKASSIGGAATLIVLGLLLVRQARRPAQHLHDHDGFGAHVHPHAHLPKALLLGLLLGLAGARSAALVLPLVGGPGATFFSFAAYSSGVAVGIGAVALSVDVLHRDKLKSWRRFIDAGLGMTTVGVGCWLGFSVMMQ